jgi:hypothetical protein
MDTIISAMPQRLESVVIENGHSEYASIGESRQVGKPRRRFFHLFKIGAQ